MRFAVLATDYDGTLASQGAVSAQAVEALQRFRDAGRHLVLVTGRELDELLGIFPEVTVFHRVVAENGGVLYCPSDGTMKVLGVPPSREFVRELIRRGIEPLAVGRSIVATVSPHETTVLSTIRDFGLELQVIFNKGSVMVLPAGVNKATGLAAALEDLKLSMRNVVAIGDAENDHAMLREAEFGVAVGNALATLKSEADYASPLVHADAVMETMTAMLDDDLGQIASDVTRRRIHLGQLADGTPVMVPATGRSLAILTDGRESASAWVHALLDQLRDLGYQCCVMDAWGGYAPTRGALVLGSAAKTVEVGDILGALGDNPATSVVVDLSATGTAQRRRIESELVAGARASSDLRGLPHWLVFIGMDGSVLAGGAAPGMARLVVHPADASSPDEGAAGAFDVVLALGKNAPERMARMLRDVPSVQSSGLRLRGIAARPREEEALLWLAALPDCVLLVRPSDKDAPAPP